MKSLLKAPSSLLSKADDLAKKDWARFKEKGRLSPDGTRMLYPFSHYGTQLKGKGIDELKNSYMSVLKKDKNFKNATIEYYKDKICKTAKAAAMSSAMNKLTQKRIAGIKNTAPSNFGMSRRLSSIRNTAPSNFGISRRLKKLQEV